MVQFPEAERDSAQAPMSRLVCIMDDDPTVRRIIEFAASRNRFAAIECRSIEELIVRASALKSSHIFISVQCADSDAVEVIRHLEQARYQGAVHLMGAGNSALLQTLADVGTAR